MRRVAESLLAGSYLETQDEVLAQQQLPAACPTDQAEKVGLTPHFHSACCGAGRKEFASLVSSCRADSLPFFFNGRQRGRVPRLPRVLDDMVVPLGKIHLRSSSDILGNIRDGMTERTRVQQAPRCGGVVIIDVLPFRIARGLSTIEAGQMSGSCAL
jgi:hypothetical protein